jgi:hypothetical protein
MAVAALLLLPLTGCGSSTSQNSSSLDVRQTQRAVASEFLHRTRAPALVLCPRAIPRRAGYSFTCSVSLAVGTATVNVTETNGSGGLEYKSKRPVILLNIAKVEIAIRESIAAHRHLTAVVTCPAYVLQEEGLVFTCTASVSGEPGISPFSVTEVTSSGKVRFIGR